MKAMMGLTGVVMVMVMMMVILMLIAMVVLMASTVRYLSDGRVRFCSSAV